MHPNTVASRPVTEPDGGLLLVCESVGVFRPRFRFRHRLRGIRRRRDRRRAYLSRAAFEIDNHGAGRGCPEIERVGSASAVDEVVAVCSAGGSRRGNSRPHSP